MEILHQTVHNPRGNSRIGEVARTPPFLPRRTLAPMSVSNHKVFRLIRDDNVLIVVPQGDAIGFRYNDVHQESNATLQILDDATLQHVVIDYGCEQVLGSIIISVIIKVCRKVGLKGGRAVFCNASPDMQEVLQTMNLVKLWKYHPTRAEAIAAVRAG